MTPPEPQNAPALLVITGASGSGKSVALRALEDSGYCCVDNLPPELLEPFVLLQRQHGGTRIAAAIDARAAPSLPSLPGALQRLTQAGLPTRTIFLDASRETLIQRFSETRRQHPLSSLGQTPRSLPEAIAAEAALLAPLRESASTLDTSHARPAQLRDWVRTLANMPAQDFILTLQSFAYKNGLPLDADFVFDARALPNPFYEPALRSLGGDEAPVIEFLRRQPLAQQMLEDVAGFLRRWLAAFRQDQRAYLTVAIGCTGGQHRSVYLVEQLARAIAPEVPALIRHRDWGRV